MIFSENRYPLFGIMLLTFGPTQRVRAMKNNFNASFLSRHSSQRRGSDADAIAPRVAAEVDDEGTN
jgi:hypothetical protein